ncbi:MAG: glycosylase [Clostridia bacterium]|nr:glycosylase [Clostridia bacterium]
MNKWLSNAVFYEIYPQTFRDSNGDGIGDFNGIIEKLDYVKDMGFSAIWLNPCFASPFYDAGYDVEDYYQAAPRYGTNEDLERLFFEVHKRGMRIILDLVPGHTAVTCKWFHESAKADRNRYTDRYIWTDSIGKTCDGIEELSGSLRGFSERDGCVGVNYYSTQPALNYGFANVTEDWQFSVDSPEAADTREELINIMRFWLEKGCDGFRVDMADFIIKNDDESKTETVRFWQRVFAVIREEYPEAVFVSEWGSPKQALKAGFDMDFMLPKKVTRYADLFLTPNSYFTAEREKSPEDWLGIYLDNLKNTKGEGYIAPISGNHDGSSRVASTVGEISARIVYAFILSLPGVPFVYYGDEIGMNYISGLKSVEGSYYRTGCRTPMQWDGTQNAGFSAADKLYIPIDPDTDRPTVEKQINDENSMLNTVRKLIAIRKANEELQADGGFEPVCIRDGYPFVYKRALRGKSILVCLNPSDKEAVCELENELGEVIFEYNGTAKKDGGKLVVPPKSASYIRVI